MKTLTVILLATGILASTVSADPALHLKVDKFDFGWTPINSTVETSFWLKSSGTDTLEIVVMVPGTDEITSRIDNRLLAPGDSTKAYFYWDVGGAIGVLDKYVTIHTNSMRERPYRVFLSDINVLRPDSLRPITIKPYRFEFSKLSAVSVDSIDFVITNHSERFLRLEEVSSPLKECEIVIPESVRPHSEVPGYIRVRPDYLDSEFVESVTILMSDGPDYEKRITVPIRRKIFSP
jgi:hypothetical protein